MGQGESCVGTGLFIFEYMGVWRDKQGETTHCLT